MQSSTRALLLTRLLVVLHLLRGKNGVELVGEILGQRKHIRLFSVDAVSVSTWQQLHRAIIQRLKQVGESKPFT